MNEVTWSAHAFRQFKKIPMEMRQAINEALKRLALTWPKSANVKKLSSREDYRLRVRDYRIIFVVQPNGEVAILNILEVKKRNERTYQ